MPGTKKLTKEKKVTVSDRARNSTRKVRKVGDLNVSYIQPQTVSNKELHYEITPATTHPSLTAVLSATVSSDLVLSLLQQLTESNQALIERVKTLRKMQVMLGLDGDLIYSNSTHIAPLPYNRT